MEQIEINKKLVDYTYLDVEMNLTEVYEDVIQTNDMEGEDV